MDRRKTTGKTGYVESKYPGDSVAKLLQDQVAPISASSDDASRCKLRRWHGKARLGPGIEQVALSLLTAANGLLESPGRGD